MTTVTFLTSEDIVIRFHEKFLNGCMKPHELSMDVPRSCPVRLPRVDIGDMGTSLGGAGDKKEAV